MGREDVGFDREGNLILEGGGGMGRTLCTMLLGTQGLNLVFIDFRRINKMLSSSF